MRFTIFFAQVTAILFVMLLWTGGSTWIATLLVWGVLVGILVFVLEAALTLCGAIGFFSSSQKD